MNDNNLVTPNCPCDATINVCDDSKYLHTISNQLILINIRASNFCLVKHQIDKGFDWF